MIKNLNVFYDKKIHFPDYESEPENRDLYKFFFREYLKKHCDLKTDNLFKSFENAYLYATKKILHKNLGLKPWEATDSSSDSFDNLLINKSLADGIFVLDKFSHLMFNVDCQFFAKSWDQEQLTFAKNRILEKEYLDVWSF